MKKLIYNKFDKLTIPSLKRVEYSGKIIVIYTTSEAEKAVDFLLSQPLLGLDTETRPAFRRAGISSARFCRWPRRRSVSSSG